MKEYKVVIYQESLLGSLMLGQSKVDPDKLGKYLNEFAKQGWRVITIEREQRRMLLVSSREAFLIVLERDR
ncbi:MAG: DUF4177 domain-containing protein [Alphaproteobacteria bacterium]|nr:DUF4177 domain-containing protein [Alphaproteobacteria bacterium]